MHTATAPDTFALWASDGVCSHEDDPRPGCEETESAKWLLDNRTDLEFNRWDQLIARDKFKQIQAVKGVNHFTLMRKPGAEEVGRFVARAMEVEMV